MSVYNGANYLREAIDSILNQSFTDFEFIIVNDGSTDESLNIIKSYHDKKIVLIDNDGNKGLIYSLNTAFHQAKGKYIARMDADDVSLPNRLQKQYDFLEQHPEIGVCSCNYTQFDGQSEKSYTAFKNHDEIFSYLFFNSSVVHPTLMLRNAVLKDLSILFDANYKHAEDYELWSRLIFKTRFSAVPETLLKYRLHPQQVTQKHHAVQIESSNRIRQQILKQAGFDFTEDELRVYCLLGNSQIITTTQDLQLLEKWFAKLIVQNKTTKLIDPQVFELVIMKHWIDACGLTNLGLKAFFIYLRSKLRDKKNENLTKLFIKCLVRRFKG